MPVRALALLMLLFAPAGAAMAGAPEKPLCYDIAVIGTVESSKFVAVVDDWNSAYHWQVRVDAVLEGRDVPRRIRVTRIGHAEFVGYPLRDMLIIAAKDEEGYFLRVRPFAQPLDPRGVLPEGTVDRLAKEAGVVRCKGSTG